MTRATKRYVLLVVLLIVVAVAVQSYRRLQTVGGPPSVTIAANFPLSGELAFYGDSLRDGLLMAAEERGGVLKDKVALSFDWGDNRFAARDTVSVLQRQLLLQPAIYTTALKPQVMAVVDEVSRQQIPHFAWILDVHANTPTTKNNLRSWVSFKLEAEVFTRYARMRTPKRVAIVFLNLPSAEEEYAQIVAPALRQNPGAEVYIERFGADVAPEEFRTIAAKVATFRPDLVMVNGFIPQMVALIRSLRPLGVVSDGNTLASLDMLDAAQNITPQELEGVVVAAPGYLLQPTDAQQQWAARFKTRFKREPAYHSAYAYDMGVAIIDAALRLNHPADHVAWLTALRATNTAGITGAIRFDEDGSLVTELHPAIYRQGALTPLPQGVGERKE